MSVSTADFWRLTVEGQLLAPAEVHKLAEKYSQLVGHGPESPADPLAEWLIAERKISNYQAQVLLAGYPGPFIYGAYRIYDRIETGRMAGMFRAIHTETRHRVCLYFLSGEAIQDPQTVARLIEQAERTRQLTAGQPHLMSCYQLVDEGAFKFIVIEDILGKRVERLLATEGAMPPHEACSIARMAALGLAHLHAQGQVHGEVRPGNLWIEPNDNAKLLMFPLSRDPLAQPDVMGAAEKPGRLPPMIDYLAPELASTERMPDARSDLYALGCTLYHMLSDRPPFAEGDIVAKLTRHASETPTMLDKLNANIPPGLAKLVNYLMAKDPDLRYQQATSVADALAAYLRPEDVQVPQPAAVPTAAAYDAWLAAAVPRSPIPVSKPQPDPVPSPEPVPAPAAVAPTPPIAPTPPALQPMPPVPVSQLTATEPHIPAVMPAALASVPQMSAPPMSPAPPGYAMPVPQAPVYAAPVYPAPGYQAPVYQAPAYQPPVYQQVPTYPAPTYAAPPPPYSPPVEAPPTFSPPPLAPPTFSPHAASIQSTSSQTSGAAIGQSRREARRQQQKIMVGVCAVLVVVCVMVLWLQRGHSTPTNVAANGGTPSTTSASHTSKVSTTTTPPVAAGPKAAGSDTASSNTATMGGGEKPPAANTAAPTPPPPPKYFDVIWGLEQPLWESPTSGPPIDLHYAAPGAQIFLVLRPAELLQHPEASRLIGSCDKEKLASPIGEPGAWLRDQLTPTTGLPAEKIEQLIISVVGGDSEPIKFGYVIRATEPVSKDSLLEAWGNPAPDEKSGPGVYRKDDTAYYLPSSGDGRLVVIAPADYMADIVGTKGEPFLRPEMQNMVRTTDASRQFTLLVYPRFLTTGGKKLFTGAGEGFLSLVNWLLTGDSQGNIEPPKALAFSAHLTDHLFAELRIYSAESGSDATGAAQTLLDRLHPLPRTVLQYIVGLDVSESSRAILVAFPDMVRVSERMLRYGTADKQVVVRLSLPDVAAHNLALGTQLALLEPPRAAGAGGASVAAAGGPKTVAEKLKKKTTLSFNRNTLEMSMKFLEEDMGVPITIRGGDLQLEGITKNQSFGLDERDKPVEAILQVIMKQANPDGKLVYIIKVGKTGGEELFITTRAAVAKNGEKLPPKLEKK